jgi:hypothetical protein
LVFIAVPAGVQLPVVLQGEFLIKFLHLAYQPLLIDWLRNLSLHCLLPGSRKLRLFVLLCGLWAEFRPLGLDFGL